MAFIRLIFFFSLLIKNSTNLQMPRLINKLLYFIVYIIWSHFTFFAFRLNEKKKHLDSK